MKTKQAITAFALLVLLTACNPGEPSSERFATQVANEIYATQTAASRGAINPANASRIAELARFSGDPVTHLAMSEAGDVLVYVTVSGIHILDAGTFEERNFIPTADRLEVFALSPDGHYAAGGAWSDITLWSLADPSQQRTLEVEDVDALAFTPDSRTLIMLTWDSLIGVQVPSGQRLFTVSDLHDAGTFVFHPSSGQIAVPQAEEWSGSEIAFYDSRSGAMTDAWYLGDSAGESIDALAFAADGSRFALGWYGAPAEIWSTAGGRPFRELTLPEQTADTRQASFLPGGRLLALMSWGGPFQLWDLETLTLSGEWPSDLMAVASSGDRVVIGDSGGVEVRDLASGEVVRRVATRSIGALALSPDGEQVALGMGDGSIEFWDRRGSAQERALTTGLAGIRALAFTARGAYLMAGAPDAHSGLWRTADGEPVTLPPGTGWPAFTPDEELAILRSPDPAQLSVWDPSDGTIRHTLQHAAPVTEFHVFPPGDILATRIEDGSIWLWDFRRGAFLRSLDDYLVWGNQDQIFSSDGSLLLALGDDNTLKIWNVADASLAFSHPLPDDPERIGTSPDFSTVWVETEEDFTGWVSFWLPWEGTMTTEDGRLGPFSSDGRLFVFDTWQEVEVDQETWIQPVLQIRRTDDGAVLQTLPDAGWAMDFSRDGSILITQFQGCEDGEICPSIQLYSVASGELLIELGGLDDFVGSLQQSQAGGVMAGLSRSGTVYVWGLP